MKPIKYILTAIVISLVLLGACSKGDNPRTGTGSEQELNTGVIQINTTTSGPDQDADGYRIAINGNPSLQLGTTDIKNLAAVPEGTHELALNEVAGNCTVNSVNPQSVSVTAGNTTSVSFDVSCKEIIGD